MIKSSRKFKVVLGVFMLFLVSSIAMAAEEEHAAGEIHEETHGNNHLGIFLGTTKEHGHYRDTIGIEYSHRINESWSIGGVIERAERENNSTLVIIVAHYRLTESLHLGLGLGRKDPKDKRLGVARLSVGYDFELGGGWLLSPEAAVDFINNEKNEQVYGLILSKSF